MNSNTPSNRSRPIPPTTRLRNPQQRPNYADLASLQSPLSTVTRRPLSEINPNTAGNKRRRLHRSKDVGRVRQSRNSLTVPPTNNSLPPQFHRPPTFQQPVLPSLSNFRVVTPPRNLQQPTSPTFEETPEEILPPLPDYHPRTRRWHARQQANTEDNPEYNPPHRRGPYQRRNNTYMGRTLGPGYQACRDPYKVKQMEPYQVDKLPDVVSNKCLHCNALSWKNERGNTGDGQWPCCDGGKNDWPSPDQSRKPADVDALPEGLQKEAELRVRFITKLLSDVDNVITNDQPLGRRTARSKEFLDNIVSYNNCLSFTSEGTTNVDTHVSRTTFRIQGSVHHLMGPLIADNGIRPKFAQIYTLDGTQEQLDVRHQYFDNLNQDTLASAQRTLRAINPYVQGFKSCYDRLKEDEPQYPINTMSVRIQQLNPKRQDKGTHNRPTSTEVARVMITPNDAVRGRIERDIRVETIEGGLMSIPDWHPSYMALRYPLLFPFGEQSWHDRLPLAGQQLPGDHPLHASRRNRVAGTFARHTLIGGDEEPEQEEGGDPEQGLDQDVDGQHVRRGRGGSQRVTRRQFYVKWMQIRPDYFNRTINSGRLFSHWVTDVWTSIELNNLNWYRQNQQTIRADCYSGLMDRLSTDPDISLKDIGSKVTILPSTMPGSPRAMKARMQDAMAIVRKRGKPEFFITFTCNPKWPDIQNLLEPGQTSEYRHDLIARVFNQKLRELMKDLLEEHVLGVCIAHCYVVEFQKRGLPHAHILLIMREEDRIQTVTDVDSVIQAFVPTEEDDSKLRGLVLQHMVHNRCTGVPSDRCYSWEKNYCSKSFPKDFRQETSFAPDGSYPFYKRPVGPPEPDSSVDNRWVVPYSPYLLKKYEAHINVEICGSIKSVFYLYKYIYKGPDQADISLTRNRTRNDDNPAPNGHPRQLGELVDEITEFQSARWIGSAEAVWKMLSFSMGVMKPHVERLQIHLPDQQRTLFQPADDQAANEAAKQKLMDSDKLRRTMLTEYFNLNRLAKEAHDNGQPLPFKKQNGKPYAIMRDPLDYLYADFPEVFTWDKRNKRWKIREKGETLGRINFISPKTKDLYYCRLLLCHVKGATSFENLRTVDGHVMGWKEACVELGLTENDRHADEILDEGKDFQGGYGLRSLFVLVLLELQPTSALTLWNSYKKHISNDCLYLLRRDFSRLQIPDDHVEQQSFAEQYALYLIDGQLEHQSTPECTEDLARYGLPIPTIPFDNFNDIPNRLLREEMSYQITPDEAEVSWNRLNADQRHAANRIVTAIGANIDDEFGAPGTLFFLNGAGGTGKTMVQNTIMQRLRSQRKVALAVASSGIASTLLQGGRTAHSRFKIPLDSDTTSSCGIKKGTNLAELMKRAHVIFWDESPMQSRYDMEAVSRSLQDICGNDQAYFGGKVVCFCGDFRQTLPVVPGGSSGQVIEACLQKACFWDEIIRLDLTINERLNNPNLTDTARYEMGLFAADLLAIGNGVDIRRSPTTNEEVSCWKHGHTAGNTIDDLVENVYTNIRTNISRRDYLSERAILAITNKDVASINAKIMWRIPGDMTTYWSIDRAVSEEDDELFPPEYFHGFYEPSLPNHKLCVKSGVPVMLLRNLNPPRLCNGTRLRVTRCGKHIFEGEIMGGTHDGEKVMLFKTPLQSKENNKRIPTPFIRKQYPVRPAFAMTINKSQGQSMKFVGINLQTRPAFSHGQLYVALSRVTRQGNLHVIGPDTPEYVTGRLMRNVVYKQVLLDNR